MLKGLSSHLSPDLLTPLAEMGHGDEIILADANFPGHTLCRRVLRADGVGVAALLGAILPVFELDSYAHPLVMMQAVAGDTLDPRVEETYMAAIRRHAPEAPAPQRIDRAAFYERARAVYAVIITSEGRKYGNILLKKGFIPSLENLA